MLDFEGSWFALAGVAAAAGPIVIHLWNRRRFRTVSWAAMPFLRQAVERQRRILRLRDLIILALRVLCVVALGLLLARPFFRSGGFGWLSGLAFAASLIVAGLSAASAAVSGERRVRAMSGVLCAASLATIFGIWTWTLRSSSAEDVQQTTARSAVHAVLVIDNSRSMGADVGGSSLLTQARQRASQFVESLPVDSRMTIIPLAGSLEPIPNDAYRSKDDARRAIERIGLVDAAGDLAAALDLAEQACRQVTDLPTKRVAVISDMQTSSWTRSDWSDWSNKLPGLQVAPVAAASPPNIWISQLLVEDGVASVESPSRILARLEARGLSEPTTAQAVLTVDGTEVGSQLVELSAGQSREIEFPHQFDVPGEPGRPHWAQVALELQIESPQADQLRADNRSTVLAPVVSALPVIFVDELGDAEDPARNRLGETYALRQLLAPRGSRETAQPLIRVEHVRPDQVTLELLETARLVIVAGVEEPGPMTALLREYLIQGGPLVVLAGGRFDPQSWHDQAWLDGAGLLPLPLRPELWGTLPDTAATLQPFFVQPGSLQSEFFIVEGEPVETLAGLFGSTPFFQTVQADDSTDARRDLLASDTERAESWLAKRQSTIDDSSEGEPGWWRWRMPSPVRETTQSAEQLAQMWQPQVLAAFDSPTLPWLIARRQGTGTVLFFTSGVTSDWNLLRGSGAMYVFHRLCYRLMERTLPRRSFTAGERITVPLDPQADVRYVVNRPDGTREPTSIEALGPSLRGVTIRQALVSGVYTLTTEAIGGQTPSAPSSSEPLSVAVAAPVSESDLTILTPGDLQQQMAASSIRVLEPGESLHLEGGLRRGQHLWKWCAVLMLGGLLLEMGVLGWSTRRTEVAA